MKRYLYILLLLISLSLIIILGGNIFEKSILKAAYRNSSVADFKIESIVNGRYEVIIPNNWNIKEVIDESADYNTVLINDNSELKFRIKIYSNKETYNLAINEIKNQVKNKSIDKKINGNEWKVLICESKDKEKIIYYKENGDNLIIADVEYNYKEYNESIKTIFERIVGSVKKYI